MAPRPGRLLRRAHKKEASPAQEGGLKSAGTMPKSSPRRNAMVKENPAFLQVQAPDFADLFPAGHPALHPEAQAPLFGGCRGGPSLPPSEVAVRQVSQAYQVPIGVQKAGRLALRGHGADRRHGDPCPAGFLHEGRHVRVRNRAQDLVIIAAG